MTATDDYFNSITYSNDAAGAALKEHNDAVAALTDLQDGQADTATVQAASQKVTATFVQYQQAVQQPRSTVKAASAVGAPAPGAAIETAYTPPAGIPKLQFPRITSHLAPVITGEPITTAVLTGVSVILSVLGIGGLSDVKKAVEKIAHGLKTVGQNLINAIWSLAHNVRWVLNALRWVWERVLAPLIDEVNGIVQRVAAIINKVLRPYLELIQKIRKHILEIYARFVLPVIKVIQQIRVLLTILKLLHVPGVKALDEKLVKIEGKLIGVIQQILYRVNDHSGLLNILLTARATIQHGILVRSLYETQGAWVNQWWNAQEWDRSSADAEAAVQLDLAIQARPHERALDDLLRTGVYTATDTPGPHERELDALLRRGAA